MVIKETITINNKNFIRQYSDENRYVIRDGQQYIEAVDPLNSGREYTEGDVIPILDESALTETEEKARAYDILMGVSE